MARSSARERSLGFERPAAPEWGESLPRSRWFVLVILFTARTAIAFQFQSVAALGPVLVQDLALDYARLGTLVGLYMLPGVIVALPGGLLGQRFGDKRIALLGLALMVLGGAWIGLSHSYGSAVRPPPRSATRDAYLHFAHAGELRSRAIARRERELSDE